MNLARYTKIPGEALALAAAAGWVALSVCGASADVAVSGSFVATKDCPAFQSFRKGTNPGGVKIETGHYTSAGAGVCIVPARFNCPPEITLHHLHVSK
jgi:predicted MPP superfamily phosphohydrolase